MESTKVCMKCGKEIPAEFIFCPFCGADQTKNICKKCGAALPDGAVYCGVCGAKIESEAPVQSVQTESFVTPENENEEVVCTPVQAENIATQPVDLTAEKTETSGNSSKNKKQNKRGDFDKTRILSITKSAIILVFCIIMIGLAFGPLARVKVDNVVGETRDQTKINYLSTIDGIKRMSATARHFKDSEKNSKVEKLERRLVAAEETLKKELEKCYNEKTKEYRLNTAVAKAAWKLASVEAEYVVSFDDGSGSVESYNAIVFGLTSLLYILFASSMLICAIIHFVFTLTGRGKDIGKFVYALPMFLFFTLALSFISGVYNKENNYLAIGDLSGEVRESSVLITALIFSIVAIIAILTISTLKKIQNGFSIKKQLLKIIPISLIIISCGCIFAPSAKSEYIVQKADGKEITFTYKYYSEFTRSSVLSKYEKEKRKEIIEVLPKEEQFDFYVNRIEKHREDFAIILDRYGDVIGLGNIIGLEDSLDNIKYGLLAQAQPDATAALAFGYYACYIVILLSGAWVCAYLSDTEKYKATSKSLQAAVGILIIIALALTIVTICVVNATMKTAEISYFSMSVGGGLIAALVMFVAFTIAAGLISGRFKDAPKTENPIEREAA